MVSATPLSATPDGHRTRIELMRWFWGLVILLLLAWLIVGFRRWTGQWEGTPGPMAVVVVTWVVLIALSALNRVPLDVWNGTLMTRLTSLIPLTLAVLWGGLLGWSHQAFACGVAISGAIIGTQIVRLCFSPLAPTQQAHSAGLNWNTFADWCHQPVTRLRGETTAEPPSPVPAEIAGNQTDLEPVATIPGELTGPTAKQTESSAADRLTGESWQVRRVEAGNTVIEGEMVLLFTAGQRDAWQHLVFEPALPTGAAGEPPQLELEPVEGEDIELKVDAVFPYGARVLGRRSLPADEPLSVRLAYMASSGCDSAEEAEST